MRHLTHVAFENLNLSLQGAKKEIALSSAYLLYFCEKLIEQDTVGLLQKLDA